ncbi:MAG TPA: CorA family divalent cation transporter [Sphingomicrobium sp.]|nr:CorA family divalent cation transporter [Sphingomicrobium sp.]
MPVTAYLYDTDGHDREVELSPETLGCIGEQHLLWIDIDCRDAADLRWVAGQLGLEQGSLATLLGRGETAGVENYGSYSQFFVETAPATVVQDNHGIGRPWLNRHEGTRLDFVISRKWLLTVHDGTIGFIDAFRERDRAETTIGTLSTHDFAASLLDAHLEAFFEDIARIEQLVDRLDEQALTSPSSRTLLGRMVTLRRRVSRLRTSLSAQRTVFYGLSRPDLQLVTQSGAAPHFQVLVGRFERAIDEVEHARDLVVGSFELFATRTAQQTNELVKVLTYLTAVVGICAAVAGIFGMNFETDFFSTGDAGFYVTIGSLLLTVIIATAIARWRGWL